MDKSPSRLLWEFHEAFDLHRARQPTLPAAEIERGRQRLLDEEVGELAEAVQSRRLDRIAHELADVVYVAYGTALAYGIDLDAVVADVHRANMTKLSRDGRPVRRNDGKVLKGAHYEPPDIDATLRRQGWQGPAPASG